MTKNYSNLMYANKQRKAKEECLNEKGHRTMTKQGRDAVDDEAQVMLFVW